MSLRRSARARPGSVNESPEGAPSSAASTSSANASPSKPTREARKRKRDGQSAGVEGTPELTAGPAVGRSTRSRSAAKESLKIVDGSGDMDVDVGASEVTGSAANGSTKERLNRVAIKVEALDPRKGEALLPELLLEKAEADKLRVIVEVYAPELLKVTTANVANGSAKANGKARSQPSLESLLAGADQGSETRTSLRSLREFLDGLRAEWSAKVDDGSVDVSKKLGAVRVLTSLIDSIAQSYRNTPMARETIAAAEQKRTGGGKLKGEEGGAAKEESVEELPEAGTAPAATKYALHMRLPLGGDYFTNAVKLSHSEAANLGTGHADLVSVVPRPRRQRHLSPPPTLGERCMPGRLNRQQPERLVEKPPAEHVVCAKSIYYEPWASFAPSYDTSDSTVGLVASQLLWRSRNDDLKALRRLGWAPDLEDLPSASTAEEQEDDEEEEEDAENGASPEAEPKANGTSFDESLLDDLDASLDPTLLKAGLEHLSQRESVDRVLEENAVLFKQLQELQLKRLRKAWVPGAKKAPVVLEEPDEQEAATAARLLDSLAGLVALRPSGSLLPSKHLLRAASRASTVIDPRLLSTGLGVADGQETGYWGTLDEKSYGPDAAYRKATVYAAWSDPQSNVAIVPASSGPAALKENDTVIPKTQAPLRAEPPTNVAATKHRKTLLDRVAGSRSYSADMDRHADAPMPSGGSQGAPGARGGPGPPPQQKRGPPQSASGPPQPSASGSVGGGGSGNPPTPARSYATLPNRAVPPGQQPQQQPQRGSGAGGSYMATPVPNRSNTSLQPHTSVGPHRTVPLPQKLPGPMPGQGHYGAMTPQQQQQQGTPVTGYAHSPSSQQQPYSTRPSVMGAAGAAGMSPHSASPFNNPGMTQSMVSAGMRSGAAGGGGGGAYMPSPSNGAYPHQHQQQQHFAPSSSSSSSPSVSTAYLNAPMSSPSPLSPGAHGQRPLPGGMPSARPHQQGVGYVQGQVPSNGWNGR